jgi:hypothetical protein
MGRGQQTRRAASRKHRRGASVEYKVQVRYVKVPDADTRLRRLICLLRELSDADNAGAPTEQEGGNQQKQ